MLLRLSALAATAAALTAFRPLSQGCRSACPVAQLAPGWVSRVDQQTGETYYLNSQTGQSQWEQPQRTTATVQWRIDCFFGVAGFSGVAGFAANNKYGDREFRLETTREGRPCQLPYIVGAGEERVLSRWNMLEQSLYVSRKQCVVRCAADGTATLTSEGKAPTLWRAASGPANGPWNALYKGEEHVLADGDQVSIDCKDPEAAVFVLYVDVGGPVGPAGGLWYVQALSNFAPQQEGELGFRAGDYIQVTQQGEPGGWWEGSLDGRMGWFPSSFCSEPLS